MSRRCDLTGVGVQVGHNVSHSNRKTKRRFLPNLQSVSLLSAALGRAIKVRITPSALRSVDHNGGIDNFLLNSAAKDLTPTAKKLKKEIIAKNSTTEEKKPAAKKAVAKKKPSAKATKTKATAGAEKPKAAKKKAPAKKAPAKKK